MVVRQKSNLDRDETNDLWRLAGGLVVSCVLLAFVFHAMHVGPFAASKPTGETTAQK
jgi:hypothetical protein